MLQHFFYSQFHIDVELRGAKNCLYATIITMRSSKEIFQPNKFHDLIFPEHKKKSENFYVFLYVTRLGVNELEIMIAAGMKSNKTFNSFFGY